MRILNLSIGNQTRRILAGISLVAMTAIVGCQSSIGGQTLPSAYWQEDDVQYFPAGPEFKLSREAAALASQGATGGTGAVAPENIGPGANAVPAGGNAPGRNAPGNVPGNAPGNNP